MKAKRLRIALWTLAAGLVLAGGLFLYGYFAVYRPYQDLRGLWPRMKSGQYIDPAEIRAICHRILSTPFCDHHDAYLMLGSCGDETSIPYLISALRYERPINEEGAMVCTSAHCLDALRKLTGKKFGLSHSQWQAWWRDYQRLKKTGQAPPLPKITPPTFHPATNPPPASVEEFPPGAKPRIEEARRAFDDQQFQKAASIYDQLVTEYPESLIIRANRGAILFQAQRYQEAEQDLTWVREKEPNNAFVLHNLGIVYTRTSQWDKATATFEAALKQDPNDPRAKEYLGIIASERNRK